MRECWKCGQPMPNAAAFSRACPSGNLCEPSVMRPQYERMLATPDGEPWVVAAMRIIFDHWAEKYADEWSAVEVFHWMLGKVGATLATSEMPKPTLLALVAAYADNPDRIDRPTAAVVAGWYVAEDAPTGGRL